MKKFICFLLLVIVFFYMIPVIKNQMDLYVTNSKDQEQVVFRIIISGIIGMCVTVCALIVTAMLMNKAGIGLDKPKIEETIE